MFKPKSTNLIQRVFPTKNHYNQNSFRSLATTLEPSSKKLRMIILGAPVRFFHLTPLAIETDLDFFFLISCCFSLLIFLCLIVFPAFILGKWKGNSGGKIIEE